MSISSEVLEFSRPGHYSTIIPVRQEDPYLCQAIDSVLNQSVEPGPVYVVVNGPKSADCESSRNVARYGGRVTLLTTPELGMVPALNCGIAVANTEFVAFLDSDDLWVSDKQEKQLELLMERPELDVATALATNFTEGSKGERKVLLTREACMFTNSTFRASTFDRFGAIDRSATHFNWLYRWWSNAHARGIQTASIGQVGTLRRIHQDNSWIAENKSGNASLLAELRLIVQQRRARGELEN